MHENNNSDHSNKPSPLILTLFMGLIGGIIGGGIIGYITVTTADLSNSTQQSKVSTSDIRSVVEESATTTVVEEAKSSVVSIVITKELAKRQNVYAGDSYLRDFFYGSPSPNAPSSGQDVETEEVEVGEGSGFIVTEDGLIVTNRHVVSEEDASYTVITDDGTIYEAEVLARDLFTDLAIMQIEAEGLPVLELGDSDTAVQGQTVIAIGNTLGEYSNTVTKGIISGLARDLGGNYSGLIQTDAAINEGNSGGPLLGLDGKVIGVNTAVDRSGEGIGFAIPINSTKLAVDSVIEHGRIIRPALGVRYITIDEEVAALNNLEYDYGVYIRGGTDKQFGVIPGSAADKAGLQEGDIILEVNGDKINSEYTLADMIQSASIGDEITIKIYRDGEEKELTATLSEMPDTTK